MRCLNGSRLEVRVGGRWHACPAAGGEILLQPIEDEAAGSIVCPPPAELCDVEMRLWPRLHSIEPTSGSADGGMTVTIHGTNLDSLRPPIRLLFATADGAETSATQLQMLSSVLATAILPRLVPNPNPQPHPHPNPNPN